MCRFPDTKRMNDCVNPLNQQETWYIMMERKVSNFVFGIIYWQRFVCIPRKILIYQCSTQHEQPLSIVNQRHTIIMPTVSLNI